MNAYEKVEALSAKHPDLSTKQLFKKAGVSHYEYYSTRRKAVGAKKAPKKTPKKAKRGGYEAIALPAQSGSKNVVAVFGPIDVIKEMLQ